MAHVYKMKKLVHILAVMSMFSTFLEISKAEISRADILATVRHMQLLAKDEKIQLEKAQTDYQQQTIALQEQTLLANKWQIEAHANAKQRDVLVYLFSVICGFWFLSGYQSFQIPILPPWKWAIEAGFFALGFAAAYAAGRYFLVWASHFIP